MEKIHDDGQIVSLVVLGHRIMIIIIIILALRRFFVQSFLTNSVSNFVRLPAFLVLFRRRRFSR